MGNTFTVSGNTYTDGGDIYDQSTDTVSIGVTCTFSGGNAASTNGGAVFASGSSTTVSIGDACTFSGNTATVVRYPPTKHLCVPLIRVIVLTHTHLTHLVHDREEPSMLLILSALVAGVHFLGTLLLLATIFI